MNELMTRLRALGVRRLLVLGGVAVVVVAFLSFAMNRMMQPTYALLYGDLDLTDSGRIVEKLEGMSVPYQLSADGTRILVPQDQVARLRMAMAEEGVPAGGSMGYEIFDRSDSIGTTSFVQNINHLRALEGEIARSIASIDRIAAARVHLVLPQRQLFARETEAPSASIVLKLKAGNLDGGQVRAIQQLTAAAVPGLKADRVSIVDDRGNLLAAGDGNLRETGPAEAVATKTREYETRMRRSLEQLVGSSVGFDKVRAEVSAELDFDRITTQTQTFDPDGQVVRSTQTVTDRSNNTEGGSGAVTVQGNLPGNQNQGGNGAQSSSDRSEETVNYEISRTEQTVVQEGGRVKRMSVAILVDGSYDIAADGTRTYQPRSQQELDQLEALVKSAMGFDAQRGDQVRVVNLPFVDAAIADAGAPGEEGLLGLTKSDFFKIGEIAVLGLVALLLTLFVVRPLVARMLAPLNGGGPALAGAGAMGGGGQMQIPGPGGQPAIAGPDGKPMAIGADMDEFEQMVDIANIEGRVKASSLRKVGEIVERHPEEAIAIMRNWMYRES